MTRPALEKAFFYLTLSILLVFLTGLESFAERVSLSKSNADLSIDLLEGYMLTDAAKDGSAFQLDYVIVPVSAIIKVLPEGKYKNTHEALEKTSQSLKSSDLQITEVYWRNMTASLSTFNFNLNGIAVYANAMAAKIPEGKGFVICITWCPIGQKENCIPFMTSFLDSINIDAGSYFESGIYTQSLYPDSEQWTDVNLEIDGKKIKSKMRASDQEAAAYLIQREYQVLTLYTQSKQWLQAWKRYYRMIYRDSFHRLQKVSFDIYNEIAKTCKDETELAQKLLYWVQDFKYEREKNSSDFTPLPSVLLGSGSDCDSRSMLLCVLLSSMNQDAIMLVSASYSHAMPAITSSHKGHAFTYNGKEYLMGETTAKGLTWGKIQAGQDNQSQWIEIFFP